MAAKSPWTTPSPRAKEASAEAEAAEDLVAAVVAEAAVVDSAAALAVVVVEAEEVEEEALVEVDVVVVALEVKETVGGLVSLLLTVEKKFYWRSHRPKI